MQVSIFVELEPYRTLLEYLGAKMWDIASWTERAKKSWMAFWLEKLAALVTVVGIGFAVYSLIAIQEERKIWYWTLLTTPAPGNSGKIEALEYLASRGIPLDSIDLSCRTMKGEEPDTDPDDPKATKCERPVYLQKLDLSKKTLGKRVDLSDAKLSYADLRDADLSDAKLRRADLSDANFGNAKLRRAELVKANLSDADLFSADLSGANLDRANLSGAELNDANFSDANLSDANFKNAIFSSYATFTNAWAWADKPPRNLPATIQIQLCKYNTEGSSGDLGYIGALRYRGPDSCIPRVPSK